MFRTWRAKILRKRLLKRTRSPLMRDFLEQPLADPELPWQQAELLAVDLETTGLDAQCNEIVSFGWVVIKNGRIVIDSARHLIVQADTPMNQSAVIHGIFDSHMEEGVLLEHALTRFIQALSGRILVLHHAPLDLSFLHRASRDLFGVRLVVPVIDTMALERRRLAHRDIPIKPGMLRLAEVRARYGLSQYPSHNALTDAMATAELLLAITAHAAKGRETVALRRLLTR